MMLAARGVPEHLKPRRSCKQLLVKIFATSIFSFTVLRRGAAEQAV